MCLDNRVLALAGQWIGREQHTCHGCVDQPFELTLKDTPLPQALKQIGNATGVRIEPTESVYNLLPWGEQTTINAKISNQSLRDALTAGQNEFGIGFAGIRERLLQLGGTLNLIAGGNRSVVEASFPLES